jgi:predicted phosphoadenosine phosphosulfate sulfurtransferase
MGNAFGQIDRQLLQLGSGKKTTERVKAFVKMWESRCYSNGIPEELPQLLAATNRAPCWKAIATAILRNDLKLRALGFTEESYNPEMIRRIEKENETKDPDLFSR